MITDRHILVEKFIDGNLSREEQQFIITECECNKEFNQFWINSFKDVSVAEAVKSSQELEAFLSTALFLDHKIVRQRKKKSPIAFIINMAAIFALSFGAFWFYKNQPTSQPVYTADVVYSTLGEYKRGSKLSGSPVTFTGGIMQVEFDGNQIVIEGPADFSFQKNEGFFLREGRAYIDASKSNGLKVHASNQLFEDIGTKFGILSNRDTSEIHVFEGEVKAGTKTVNAGNARRISKQKSIPLSLKRGLFVGPGQLVAYEEKRRIYEKSKKDIISTGKVIDYYDFMNLNKNYIDDIGKQINLSSSSLSAGPYAGSTSLSFNQSGDFIEMLLPNEDCVIAVEYKFIKFDKDVKELPFMSLDEGRVLYEHEMYWYKETFYDKSLNHMKEDFYKWRRIFFLKQGADLFVCKIKSKKNKFDLVKFGTVSKKGQLTFGLSDYTKFEGNIARIVILQGNDISELTSYFEKNEELK